MQSLRVCPQFNDQFRSAYLNGNLRTGSDGSAPYHGSFGWAIIDFSNGTKLADGGGTCSHFHGLTSHRMEAAGLLGTDLFLAHIQKTMQLPVYNGVIEHICDNLEAVNRYNTALRRHTTDFGKHDMDIHLALADNQSNIPPRHAKWIKGHQDESTDDADLSLDARLNIDVDALANKLYSESPSFLPPPPTTSLYHGHSPITWNVRRFLERHHGANQLRQYILSKHENWTDDTFDSIAWQSFQSALNKLQEYEKTRIIKFANRWSATASRRNDWDRSVDQRCPNCRRSDRLPSPYIETENHILRCQHDQLHATRYTALAKLESTMAVISTPRDVSTAIIYGLRSWMENERYNGIEPDIEWPPPTFDYHPTHHAPIQQAFEQQCEIGWDEFLRGRISSKWGATVNEYYRNMNLNQYHSDKTWETKVIHSTWQIFLQTWQARNNLLHGADDTENRAIQSRDIDQQIRNAYRLDRECIAPQHQGLFTTVDATISKPLDIKMKWLHSISSTALKLTKSALRRERS